jgi:hypothetical protein
MQYVIRVSFPSGWWYATLITYVRIARNGPPRILQCSHVIDALCAIEYDAVRDAG